MCPDEIYHDMNDYGFFVDMETNMFLCENPNISEPSYQCSDSDLVDSECFKDAESPIVTKRIGEKSMMLIHVTSLIGVTLLCYKLWST